MELSRRRANSGREPTPSAHHSTPYPCGADGGMARAVAFRVAWTRPACAVGEVDSDSISRGATGALDFAHFGPGPCCWRCYANVESPRSVRGEGFLPWFAGVGWGHFAWISGTSYPQGASSGIGATSKVPLRARSTPDRLDTFTTQNISRTTHTPALALYREMTFLLLLLVLSTVGLVPTTMAMSFQPEVITVESHPSRQVFGSLSMPEGSPWCDGMPTYWLVRYTSASACCGTHENSLECRRLQL
jgi:hypothetical protein